MDPTAPATLQDVADRAGVSRATASLALRGKGRMADVTRARIRAAAEELDYVVNMTARNLRTSRAGAIGVHIPDNSPSYRYYMDVALGAVERAQESDLLVTLLPNASEIRSPMLDQLDGFVIIDPVDDDPTVARLLGGRRPVVCGEAPAASFPEPWAIAYGDHDAGMRMLLDHLWANGARRPAALLPAGIMSWSREMAAAYTRWCEERGVPARLQSAPFDPSEPAARTAADGLLTAGERPDAVITAPEGMATVVRDAAGAAGLELGHDLLLASYVDSEGMRLGSPPITSLDLRAREMGRTTADLLIGALEGTVPRGTRRPVGMDLVVRESTRRR